MAIVAGRPIKQFFFLFLGLSIFLLMLNTSAYFRKTDPSIWQTSSVPAFNKNDSKNLLYTFKLSTNEKYEKINEHENINRLKYEDSNTKIVDKFRNNMKNGDFNSKIYRKLAAETEKKDWHDYEAIKVALSRTGLGELGIPVTVEKDQFGKVEAAVNESVFNYGFNGYLSDQISVNRSVPDHRSELCKSKSYLAKLPKVSIIMPFRDECFSTLIRSVHSIVNRTPPELLEEIILVDDNSVLEHLKVKLQKYVDTFFPKVKLIRLLERQGIMRARLTGAKLAKSTILVFLDAHIEVGYNWIPPLIEPIVLNNKTCTCPYIDKIQAEMMGYIPTTGFRGGFDWSFYYHHLPLLSQNDETIPHQNPVMAGGLFAIGAEFFWKLGGYDNQLHLWGGEQYELSFKIWMCGGTLLDIPCSRVAHLYQSSMPLRYRKIPSAPVFRNYMRIAQVWMDDYKKYIFQNIPERFKNIDIGDISIPNAVRENLQCKSFEWYLKEIAFDSLKHYPYEDPPAYAGGAIRSIKFKKFCLTIKTDLSLKECGLVTINPKKYQRWLLTEKGEIRKKGETKCLEAKTRWGKVYISDCRAVENTQKWLYNETSKMIVHSASRQCLVAAPLKTFVFLSKCHESRDNLRWEFDSYNETN